MKRYWEIHGKRRPFPALYVARNLYGEEAVAYSAPHYEKENQCPWCGGEVNDKRRRFCCDECRQQFANMTVWNRGRDQYSLRMEYRDNFTCQDCGEFHAYINKHGMPIPIDDGQLEVHHITPVCVGGGDEPENLVTLCKECHQQRHKDIQINHKPGRKIKAVEDGLVFDTMSEAAKHYHRAIRAIEQALDKPHLTSAGQHWISV